MILRQVDVGIPPKRGEITRPPDTAAQRADPGLLLGDGAHRRIGARGGGNLPMGHRVVERPLRRGDDPHLGRRVVEQLLHRGDNAHLCRRTIGRPLRNLKNAQTFKSGSNRNHRPGLAKETVV